MVTDVLPLRAIVLQCLLLTVAVAIESAVLLRRLQIEDNQPISPKQSIQYALSLNLLSTVLGWFTVFSFFQFEESLPTSWSQDLEVALLNFIFFNQFSEQSLSLLIVVGFLTFFVSFVIKQVGLWGLRWLLHLDLSQVDQEPEPENEQDGIITRLGIRTTGLRRMLGSLSRSEVEKAPISGIRDLRAEPRDNLLNINIAAVLFAHAWSHSATLVILLLLNFAGTRF